MGCLNIETNGRLKDATNNFQIYIGKSSWTRYRYPHRLGPFKYKDCVLKATLEDIEKDYIKLKEFIEDPEDMEYFLCNPFDIPIEHKGPPIYYTNTFKNTPPKKFKKQRKNYQR